MWSVLPRGKCGERGAEPLWDDALAVGRVGLLFEEAALTSSRTRRREKEGPGRGPRVPVTLAGLTAPFAFPLTAGSSSPRKMYSSVAHLARANPFNAPHLQLVYDGLAGPCSSPAGPPGPPRRSRNLAAAAVEGEVRPCPDSVVMPTRGPLGLAGPRRAWRTGKDVPSPPHRRMAPSC